MTNNLVVPLLLLLALGMLLAAVAMLASGPPSVTVELHRARLSGDDQYTQLLERQLDRRRHLHTAIIAFLFTGAVLLTVVALAAMRPSSPARPGRRRR